LLIIAGPWCVILQIRCSFGRRRKSNCTRLYETFDLWCSTGKRR
jgi:hypothetical protein